MLPPSFRESGPHPQAGYATGHVGCRERQIPISEVHSRNSLRFEDFASQLNVRLPTPDSP